jgi:hypothetical protein
MSDVVLFSGSHWLSRTVIRYGDLRPKFILYNKGDTTCKLPLYDEWITMQQTSVIDTAGYEGALAPKLSEKVFKRHLLDNVLRIKKTEHRK